MRRLTTILFLLACPCLAQDPTPAEVTVKGRVVDAEGRPLGGVSVAAGRREEILTAAVLESPMATTGDDGRFSFRYATARRIGEGADDSLFAVARGRASIARRFALERSKQATEEEADHPRFAEVTDVGDLVLIEGAPLFGRVRDTEENPLPSVRVVATDLFDKNRCFRGASTALFCAARTGEQGIFSLPYALPQAVVLSITAEGFYERRLQPVATSTPLEIVLERSGPIAGRVLDSLGRGLSGARIQIEYELQGAPHSVVAGPDGSFRTSQRRRGRYRIIASGRTPDGEVAKAESAILEKPFENLEVTAALSPADERKGRSDALKVLAIEKGSRKPVTEFRAIAVFDDYANQNPAYLEYRMRHGKRGAKKATGGVAEIPGPGKGEGGVGVVRVLAPGFAPATVREFEWKDVPEGKERDPLVVEMVRESSIRGVARDERTGEPIAGAKVWARPWSDPLQGTFREAENYPDDAVETAADGSFELRGLGEGRWQVEVRHDKRPLVPPLDVRLKAEENREGLIVEMPPGARVSGKITGSPIGPGWKVFLHKLPQVAFGGQGYWNNNNNSYAGVPEDAVGIAADGTFAFEGVRLANYLLVVVIPSRPRQGSELFVPIEPFRVRAQGIEKEFDISGDLPGTIEGRISFPKAGVPFHRLCVVAQVASAELQSFFNPLNPVYLGPRTLVGPGGRFSLLTGPGTYRIQLVDLATNLLLWKSEKPVDVRADRPVGIEVAPELAELIVRWKPEKEGAPMALFDRIEMRVTPVANDAQNRVFFGGNDNYDFGVGIDVPPDAREVEVVVPPSKITFLARSSFGSVDPQSQRNGNVPLGRADFETSEGARAVEIPIGPPPRAQDGKGDERNEGESADGG
ncbi:MAG: hypothetical protein Fur0037_06940 [Planctomycetota bacterium]